MENGKKPILKKLKQRKYIKPDEERRTETLMNVRLTKEEKARLFKEFSKSHFSKQATFIRFKLFETKYTDYRRKQYEAEIAAGKLINEVQKLGVNINQIAKRLNTYKDDDVHKSELLLVGATAKLLLRIENILKNGG